MISDRLLGLPQILPPLVYHLLPLAINALNAAVHAGQKCSQVLRLNTTVDRLVNAAATFGLTPDATKVTGFARLDLPLDHRAVVPQF